MAMKLLLVAFTTSRMMEIGGKEEERRVRFKSGSVVDLTDDEMETLERLTKATGKLHFREPIREGGAQTVESEPVIVDVPDYAGQDVAIDKKTVDQLKAYLTFHSVDIPNGADKAKLAALAADHAKGAPDGNNALDNGL
jgi:hypothetical protein